MQKHLKQSVQSLLITAAQPPTDAIRLVACEEAGARRNRARRVAKVIETLGAEGLRRIAERAIVNAFGTKVKTAFRGAYEAFKSEWRTRPEEERRQYKDVLDAFAVSKLRLARSTVGKYLAGKIHDTPAPNLELHLLRLGKSTADIAPTPEERKTAVMAETIAAVLRARKMRPDRVKLSSEEVKAIDLLASCIPAPHVALDDAEAWKTWLTTCVEQAQELMESHGLLPGTLTPEGMLVAAGDWQAVNRVVLWQIIAAVAILLPILRIEAAAAQFDGQTHRTRKRLRNGLMREWENIRNAREYYEQAKDDSYIYELNLESAVILKRFGNISAALQLLSSVAEACTSRHIPYVTEERKTRWRAEVQKQLNVILTAHLDHLVEHYREDEEAHEVRRQENAASVRQIVKALAGQRLGRDYSTDELYQGIDDHNPADQR